MPEYPSTTSLQHSARHSHLSSSSSSPRAPQERFDYSYNESSQSSPIQSESRHPQRNSGYISPLPGYNVEHNPHGLIDSNNPNYGLSDGSHSTTTQGYPTTNILSSDSANVIYPIPPSPYTSNRTPYPVPQESLTSNHLQYSAPHSPEPSIRESHYSVTQSLAPSNQIPYPIHQDSFTANIDSYQAPMNSSSHQPLNYEVKQSEDTYNNVTIISGSHIAPTEAKTKTGRKPRLLLIVALICLIAIGVGVGVAVSKKNGDNNNNNNESQNSNGTPTTTKPTATLPPILTQPNPRSTTATATVTITVTTTATTTASTSTTKPSNVIPPPTPSLPPKGTPCPDFLCIHYWTEYEEVCSADPDYKVCADPCNGEFFCRNRCMVGNACFEAGEENKRICNEGCRVN